jgi:hypothetical protein
MPGLLRDLYDVIDHATPESAQAIVNDPVLGRWIAHLHGTRYGGGRRFEVHNILARVIYGMVDPGETELTFEASRFERAWDAMVALLTRETVDLVIAAPIPHLIVEGGAVRLPNDIELGPLTDGDLDACIRHHILHVDDDFPMLMAHDSVGVRRQTQVEVIQLPDEPPSDFWKLDVGSFGQRAPNDATGTVDDTLLLLRLFKPRRIRCAGSVSYVDGMNLGSQIMMLDNRAQTMNPSYDLALVELPALRSLYQALVTAAEPLAFPLRRYSSAWDRNSTLDVLVDLVIAAESLLLSEIDGITRGELKFRLALRAALFCESSNWDRRAVFRIMNAAYDVRSGVVHGGKGTTEEKLPDGRRVPIHEFTTEVAELVRVGLVKAVTLLASGVEFRQSAYWIELALPLSPSEEGH